jgi:hypothetical protein
LIFLRRFHQECSWSVVLEWLAKHPQTGFAEAFYSVGLKWKMLALS